MGAIKNWIHERAIKVEEYIDTLKPCELACLYGQIADAIDKGYCPDIDDEWWQDAEPFDIGWYCAENGINFDDSTIESCINDSWEHDGYIVYLRSSMFDGWWYQTQKIGESKRTSMESDEEIKKFFGFVKKGETE